MDLVERRNGRLYLIGLAASLIGNSAMTLVAGVDSSTQSCKVVVRELESGAVVRSGRAAHPDGTEVDPEAWEASARSPTTEP